MPISRCNSAGFRILLGLALLLASIAMLSPGSGAPLPFWQADKLVHAFTFAVLALLTDGAWPQQGFGRAKALPLLGYGIAIELLQTQIPKRGFELLDILADASGLLIYSALVLPLLRRWKIR